MAESFKGMTAKEYVDRSAERYEQMVETFEKLIVYHDRVKFEELAEELLSGAIVVDAKLGSVKYCMLRTSEDPLFGLNTKRFEFNGRLEKALFYGNRPCMDLKPTSILCEMMAGSQRDGEYASELVLGLHAYRPCCRGARPGTTGSLR